MEALVNVNSLKNNEETQTYPFKITIFDSIYCIDSSPMWQTLLDDLQQQIPPGIIAAKFHKGLAKTIVEMVQKLTQEHLINQVVLTGGVFQNSILLEQVTSRLQALGINVLTHSLVPSNDGGLSLGQAIIAASQLIS